jgi:tRNA-dihydrouridine synthase 3
LHLCRALAQNLVKGERQEWSLIRRHSSESIFGVQLAGAHLDTLTRAVQLLTDPQNDIAVDFIDLNVGCPVDLITKKGMGCALVTRPAHLTALLRGMVDTAQHVPVTVKLRIGAQDYSNKIAGSDAVPVERRGTIHRDILPHLSEVGVSAVTIHGRSHRQRYLRAADWQYIAHCTEILAEHNIPLIGNGDIHNWEEAQRHFEQDHVTALMIARSALIKPWIFKARTRPCHVTIRRVFMSKK